MFRVAICDDDAQELLHISNLLELYRLKNTEILFYQLFNNSTDLLETIKAGDFDMLILDIFMPITDGIQAAKEIRRFDSEIKIVFLTSSSEYAVQSYTVNAYYYLLKPCTEERLFPIMDKILSELRSPDESFIVKFNPGILRIPFGKLEFLEILNKKLHFHMTDGSVNKVSGTLLAYEQSLLARPEFIKVHRSYIVNMHWIYIINSKEIVTYTNKKIPISRHSHVNVRKNYMKYLFVEKGVE